MNAAVILFELWLTFQILGLCFFAGWFLQWTASDIANGVSTDPLIFRLFNRILDKRHARGTKRPAGGHQSTVD